MELDYTLRVMTELLAIDSPTGHTRAAIDYVQAQAQALGCAFRRTNKGNAYLTCPGTSGRSVALAAHVDTLGLMCRSVKADGKLAFTSIGGILLPTLDGVYCRVYTRDGRVYTGTVLSTSPAVHVYEDAQKKPRDEANMEVRLDEPVKTAADTKALGIAAGDFICIDPKTVVTPSGYIKSRFLDDKAGVAILLGLLKLWRDEGRVPRDTVHLFISTYEEVGHGLSFLPEPVEELIAVDMGCIGADLTCTEHDVSICAKDSTGPYDEQVVGRMIGCAQKINVPYAVDIYPAYGSDLSAALRGGNDVRGCVIGPGVHASHGMERTHIDAVRATLALLDAYLK